LDAELAAGAHYWVQAGQDSLPLEVGDTEDRIAPKVIVDAVQAEGLCAHVQLYSDEVTTAELRDANGAVLARRDVAALAHELAAPAPLGPALLLLATDLSGNSGGAWIDW